MDATEAKRRERFATRAATRSRGAGASRRDAKDGQRRRRRRRKLAFRLSTSLARPRGWRGWAPNDWRPAVRAREEAVALTGRSGERTK